MKRFQWFSLLIIVGLIVFGCSSLSKDMRASNSGFDELSEGNYQKAEEYFDEALSENPDNPDALLNMGVVYQNTNRKEKARQMYEKVISLNAKETAWRSTQDWAEGEPLVDIAKRNLNTLQ